MSNGKKMKVAIIGCGKIAKDHIGAIQNHCGDVEISLCDVNKEMAISLAKSLAIKDDVYTSADRMFEKNHFDIVHILTPPMSHFDLAMKALESRTHVFLEKPITYTKSEADKLFDLANEKGLLLCSGHSLLFMQCYLKAIGWIRQGKYGDVLSAYCFFGHSEKKKTIAYGGVSHWAYAMPGGPLLNLLSHPASVIVDLIGMPQHIQCMASARNLMPYNMKDIVCMSAQNGNRFGLITISMAHGSSARYIMIECEKGGIYVDLAKQVCIPFKNKGKFGPISKALIGVGQSWSFLKETVSVTSKVALGRLKSNPGTRELVSRFYKAVREKEVSPVSRENAIGVSMMIDAFLEANQV